MEEVRFTSDRATSYGIGRAEQMVETVLHIARSDAASRHLVVGGPGYLYSLAKWLIALAPPDFRPAWSPHRGLIRWPNGARTTLLAVS